MLRAAACLLAAAAVKKAKAKTRMIRQGRKRKCMGEGLAVEKKEIRNVSGSRGTKTRTSRDTYATILRYI